MVENVIKKIFSGKADDDVHADFIKFGKGSFTNRYLIEAKKQKDKWNIKTNSELAKFLVRKCLENASGEVIVSGAIIGTSDLRAASGGYVFDPEEKIKQFMGVKQLIVKDVKVKPEKVIQLMDKFPKAFFALSFSTKDSILKTKAKAPKSAKPAAGGEKAPAATFCSLKTTDKNLVGDLFFDIPDFDEITARHTLEINQIIIPKGETDPVKIRELAQRKGKLIRELNVNGRAIKSEKDFLA